MQRCSWCGNDREYIRYHDEEWGHIERDGVKLFEKMCLEAFQAGLSWITILRKRDNFRKAFHQFQPELMAKMTEHDVEELMLNKGIIRNRLKINAVIHNAALFLEMGADEFSQFMWSFTGGTTIINHPKTQSELPAITEASQAMAKALKKRGFKFFGPTTAYALMQATGMVNDHLEECSFKYAQ